MKEKGGKRLAGRSGARTASAPSPAAPTTRPASVPTAPPTPPVKAPATPAQTAPTEAASGASRPATPSRVDTAASAGKKRGLRRLWDDYGFMVVTLAVVFVVFKVILQLAYVPSGSMETTLPTKCLMVGWRLPYAVSDPVPERGDIVTFWSEEMEKVLVKRVIGLPGEKLTFKDGYVYINGEKLVEFYLPQQGITESAREFEVPEGHIFVMGDNRTGSHDSRYLNDPYIPVECVQARMLIAVSIGSEQSWQGVHWIG